MDTFINLWIALEALGMSERENIRPLTESLARAYDISFEEARDRFQIGRIFNFRSKIVHQGCRPTIDGALISYLIAVFRDVLFEISGLPSERLAEQEQASAEWAIERWLQIGEA